MGLPRRQRLFLLKELLKRDLASRYAGSALGLTWAVIEPLWQLALFTFVFSVVLKVSPLGERTDSFAIFLFCGLLPWMSVQEGVRRSATILTDHATVVKKLGFPTEILVSAAVLAAFIRSAIAGTVFLLVLIASGQLGWRGLALLLLAVPLQLALTLGLGLMAASLHVFARDVAPLLNLIFGAWFYLTPIVYPIVYVPEAYREWVLLESHGWARRPVQGRSVGWRAGLRPGPSGPDVGVDARPRRRQRRVLATEDRPGGRALAGAAPGYARCSRASRSAASVTTAQ